MAGRSLFHVLGREEGRKAYFRRVHRVVCSLEGLSVEEAFERGTGARTGLRQEYPFTREVTGLRCDTQQPLPP